MSKAKALFIQTGVLPICARKILSDIDTRSAQYSHAYFGLVQSRSAYKKDQIPVLLVPLRP